MRGASILRMRTPAAAGGGSDPFGITSAEAWFDMSLLSGSNGSNVASLPDQTGNGFTASPNGATEGQLVTAGLNGLNVLSLPIGKYYTVATSILNGATAASWIAVFSKTADPPDSSSYGAVLDGFGTDTLSSHHPYSSGTMYDGFATSARKTLGDPTPSLTTARIFCVRSAANDYTAHLDGSSFYSTATNTVGIKASGSGTRYIGANLTPTALAGRLAELIIFRAALTQAERETLEGYLAHKWFGAGASNNLPGGHPYKSTPPA